MAKPTLEEMQERIDHLGEDIEAVRHLAEEHGTLPNPHHHRTFADPDGDDEQHQVAPGTNHS